MKKKINNKVFYSILVGLFLVTIAIGYADISDLGLFITGNATSSGISSAEDFEIGFTNNVTQSVSTNTISVQHNIVDNHNAEFTVTGMYGYNETATINFEIENSSEHCFAAITTSLTNSNPTYFDVSYSLVDSHNNPISVIPPQETATLRITGRVLKVATDSAQTTNVSVNIIATSEEDPGE